MELPSRVQIPYASHNCTSYLLLAVVKLKKRSALCGLVTNMSNKVNKRYALLIEDDPSLQKACRMKFADKGVALHVVGDGQEMIDVLEKGIMAPPAVVILDLLLPHVSGFDVLEKIRQTQGWKTVPVVILTNVSHQPEDIELKMRRLGVKEYIIKTDVTLDRVMDKILSYYNEKR